jgi:2',3'-cyclic-nucleotide 2'-phosphodiesterase (5'-nucleotidase family)
MTRPSRREAIRTALRLGLVSAATPALLSEAFAQTPAAPAPVTAEFTLVLVNDLDGMGDVAGRGGHAKLATVVKQERAARRNTLLVHAGDAYSPSILSGFDKGFHIVEMLNLIKPDVFTPGNHEFDFGPEVFRQRIKESTFPCVAGNIFERDGKLVAGLVPTRMVEIDGIKVGFLGVTTEDTVRMSSPGDITITPAVATAQELAATLRREGADLVVAVTHIGFNDDIALVRSRAADIVLSGHDHNLVVHWDGRVLLVESASQADFVTPIDVRVQRTMAGDQKRISWLPVPRPLDTTAVAPDPEIARLIAGYEQSLDKELNIVIGKTSTEIDTRQGALRGVENAFGNLVADAMRAAVGADVAMTNSGGIRANRVLPAGTEITRRHILEELPFGNRTVMLEITGEVLKGVLDFAIGGGGAFPQVSGMVIEANRQAPAGSRILSLTVDGQPLDPARTYTFATNDFVARGGDGFAALAAAKSLIDPLAAQYMAGHVVAHITKAGTIAPKVEGRIVLKP